ncbi:MAG TPA: sigma factor-like helix-turn-helix DNA-binding protein [Ureibacillus sp.]|nr:sigma factor-like helix-turn-helix DNA-binding protein [Ureibacillus sp.]
MEINKSIVESHNFAKFLEDEENNVIYLKSLSEPSEENANELNEAYKVFEKQLMIRAYLKKAIQFEAKRFDKKIRSKEKLNISIDKQLEEGVTLGDFLMDEGTIRTYEEMWDTKLEELFVDRKLYQAIINLTHKQRKALYLLYLEGLSEKEAASQLNVTQQAISKVHRAAINKLKAVMKSDRGA